MSEQSLKNKTISGLFWSLSDIIANRGISFIIQVILARLLLPKDFGLVGMITVFIAISQTISDSGFTSALIREEESTEEDYSTAFLANLVLSVVLYIIIFIFAPYISSFFDEPKLINLLRVFSLVIPISSLGIIQRTILIKEVDFKTQTKINLITSVLSGIIAVIFALLGFGVWSLVIRNLLYHTIQAILLSVSNRWMPSFIFSIRVFKRLLEFGWKLLASGLIDTLYQNVYYVVIGKTFSATALGYYTNANKLKTTASSSITMAIEKVSYPVLSKLKNDNKQLKNGYQKIIKNSVYLIFPAMMGLAAIGNSLIPFLFGNNWMESIPYFQILCFAGMIFPLHAINLNILKVKGRSDLFLGLEVIKKIIAAIFIGLVVYFKIGIIGLLLVSVVNSYIAYFINSYFSAKLLCYSTWHQIKDILPAFIMSLVMGGIVYLSQNYLPSTIYIKLVLQIIIGAIIYVLLSKIFKVKEFDTILALIKGLLEKRSDKKKLPNHERY